MTLKTVVLRERANRDAEEAVDYYLSQGAKPGWIDSGAAVSRLTSARSDRSGAF